MERFGNNYLPRLPRDYYLGNAVVHWTMPVSLRERGWLTPAFHLPGYPNLHPLQAGFWPKFWKLYAQMLQPDAANRTLPPL